MSPRIHRLYGCRPEPLGSYLKALGIFRLVAQQADAGATGHWEPDGFVLSTELDDEELCGFFLERYRPTPVVSPWNAGSGFGTKRKGHFGPIEISADPRLLVFRTSIAISRELLVRGEQEGWVKDGKLVNKERLISECRSQFPDECLAWLDASVVIDANGKAVYPPILGSGGNVGSLDISDNFHEHLAKVLGIAAKKGDDPQAWLQDSLFELGKSKGVDKSASQFDSGASGGTNSGPMGKGQGVVNPWDFVLTVEGAVLFAGAAARRLGYQSRGVAAAPFMAYTSAGGFASSSEDEPPKGELWAPLWDRPASFPELQRLFSEGRADWKGSHARSGLDLAKSAGSMGVDRGISTFSRHVFLERDGQNAIAVSAGRVIVRERPNALPLADLDRWLDTVGRGGDAPASVRASLRRVERLSFSVASGQDERGLLSLLVEVAKLEADIGRATGFRNKARVSPVNGLRADEWVPHLVECYDGPELRLAISLASGRDVDKYRTVANLRTMLRPVRTGEKSSRLEWGNDSSVQGFGVRPIVDILAEAHARRVVDIMSRCRSDGDDGDDGVGVATRFQHGIVIRLDDLAALVRGGVDEALLSDCLAACMVLDWDRSTPRLPSASTERIAGDAVVIPPALAILGPFYAKQPASGLRQPDQTWDARLSNQPLRPEASWPALLAADHVGNVLAGAVRRLQIAGLRPLARKGSGTWFSGPGDGPRLAAALLCPIGSVVRRNLLRRSCPDPEISDTDQSGQSQSSSTQEEEAEHAQSSTH